MSGLSQRPPVFCITAEHASAPARSLIIVGADCMLGSIAFSSVATTICFAVACSPTSVSQPARSSESAVLPIAGWPSQSECDALNDAVAEPSDKVTAELVLRLRSACARVGCACDLAGMAYKDGVGVVKDVQTALTMFEDGCAKENWSSCSEAGFLYEGKSGIPADLEKMRLYLERGCEHAPWICQNLAFVYVQGLGVSPDYPRAERFMRRACDAWAPGCITLANFLLFRAGKPDEAERIFALACQRDASLCDRSWPD